MEMMPFNSQSTTSDLLVSELSPRIEFPEWQSQMPILVNQNVKLRELRLSDAFTLLSHLTVEEVSRFISPPPVSVTEFERFIAWTHRRRAAGQHICLGIVPAGREDAVGIFQLQMPASKAPEWGFAMGVPFWGTGLFVEGADAVLDFAFRGLGIEELGACAAIENKRGNAALRKLGAVRERIIPAGLVKDGVSYDQYYWTITPDDRPRKKVIWDVSATH
jgi:RimJ/RimL family protein N-acetyltransferase